MWLFPWNQNSDFYSQYKIGDHVTNFDGKSIWTLFDAEKKNNSEKLSIFRVDFKEPNSNSQVFNLAKQSLKRIKTLRHPSILKYVDSSESEKSICIVTERVTILADYLEKASTAFNTTQREFSIAYGLQNVAKGLQFMNNDCQLNHNNINIWSIFVNISGVWKIGNLEYVCAHGEQPPARQDKLSEKYTPLERLEPDKVRQPGGKFAVDSWGFGCLVWESFNKPITENSSIKTVGKMPKPLGQHYNKLVQSSPKHRISPGDFIKQCKQANVFFNTSLMEMMTILDEIHLVKEQAEKAKFFAKLGGELGSFPNDFCIYKILPDLITAYEYVEAGATILNPIFTIGKMLDPDEYESLLVPFIIKLYSCKDRATRSKLLQQLEAYIKFLKPVTTNDVIFPQVVIGLMDSNLTIREQTIKGLLHIAPHLTSSNLNEELIKHLSRAQTNDQEGAIRANATVCLGKVAKLFDENVQQMQLLACLLRTTRDPFPPARQAAVSALSANETLFNYKNCASKIMPALCLMTLDPNLDNRKLALKSLKLFLDRGITECEKEASKSIENQDSNHQDSAQKKPSDNQKISASSAIAGAHATLNTTRAIMKSLSIAN